MKLLEITNDFPPTVGGIENYIYSILARWNPEDVTVLTRARGDWQAFDAKLSFRVERDEVRQVLPSRRLRERAQKLGRSSNAEIIHFAAPLLPAVIGPYLKEELGIPYAVSLHGGEFVMATRLPYLKRLLRKALSEASVLLCESTFVQRQAKEAFPEIRSEWVPAGVDVNTFTPVGPTAFQPPVPGPVIICVSRLVARKGPAVLIEAMPAILKQHPTAHLLIVGGGPDAKRLKRLAGGKGVASKVTLAGARPWDRIPDYYRSADVFAMPTRERFWGLETEGLPLALLEAAASGLPAIGGNAGSVSDGVVHGETGLLVDGGDPTDVASAIIDLLDDPDKAKAMGAAGRDRVTEGFTWGSAFRLFERGLETALEG
jgi:phosphatidylinositol alpha-1,6-mannosyltransferase